MKKNEYREQAKKRLKEAGCCTQPDTDEPEIFCGRPLPCHVHTIEMDEQQCFDFLGAIEKRERKENE